MPDMVTATNTISITINIITNIINTSIIIIRWHPRVDTGMVDTGLNYGATGDPAARLHLGRACWEVPRCLPRVSARDYSGQWPARTQGEYLAIEGTPPPYADGANAGEHAMGPAPPSEATVNTLHVQKYGGGCMRPEQREPLQHPPC